MATKLKDRYGTIYARGMRVKYASLYNIETNMLAEHGIETNKYYYIRTIRKAIDKEMLLLELFKEPEFINFVGTFHSSFFNKPQFDTPAARLLYEKA